MKATTRSKTGGCGCGAPSGCGCGCGGVTSFDGRPVVAGACDPCEEASFVRPRFFAGQLLTEDDLEALNAYVVGKNRLHNARLFGDGVVCGFEVVCGPCGGDTVVVKPGYALDCCGNDLVLSCDRQLDIGDMVAALREQLRPGHGCPDPCVGKKGSEEPCPEPEGDEDLHPSVSPATAAAGSEVVARAVERPGLRPGELAHPHHEEGGHTPIPAEYCLYVRYQERYAEPTTPYPVGDDCAATGCEATRVLEGVTFELRCPSDPADPSDVMARVVALLERLSFDGRALAELQSLRWVAQTAPGALRRLERGAVELADDERVIWQEWLDRLDKKVSRVQPAELARFVAQVGGVYLRTGREQGSSEVRAPERPEPELTEKLLRDAVERLTRSTTLEKLGRFDRALAQDAALLFEQLRDGAPTDIDAMTGSQQLYLYGWAEEVAFYRALAALTRDLQRALLRAVNECAGELPDCTVRDQVANLPAFVSDVDVVSAADVKAQVGAIGALIRATYKFVREEACMALIPPCPPCDDPAVLLACIKVDGCKVVEICNLVRRFVWSPMALRYWLPPLTWFGDAIEEACCGAPHDHDPDIQVKPKVVDKKMKALQAMLADPGVGSMAEVVHAVYRRAPDPRILTTMFQPVLSLGARPAARPMLAAESPVSRAEFEELRALVHKHHEPSPPPARRRTRTDRNE